MNYEEFERNLKANAETTNTELNNYLSTLQVPSSQFMSDRYNFTWGNLQSLLNRNRYFYSRRTKSFSQNNKQTSKNTQNQQPEKNDMLERIKNNLSSDKAKNITPMTFRIPTVLAARLDEQVKGTQYTKNQFVIDLLEYGLDALEK